jgi:hypothetical protein
LAGPHAIGHDEGVSGRADDTEVHVDLEVVLEEDATLEYPRHRAQAAQTAPDAESPPRARTAPDEPDGAADESTEILDKLLGDAEEHLAANRVHEAIDLLELAMLLDPKNDVVRARLSEITAARKHSSRPPRGDETVPLDLD